MSLTPCLIRFTKKPNKAIYLTAPLLAALKIKNKKDVVVKFGGLSMQVRVKAVRGTSKIMYLPAMVRSTLMVPQMSACQLHSDEEQIIRIGPLVGVLTASGAGGLAAPFGNRTGLIKQLLRAGRNRSYFFAFRP